MSDEFTPYSGQRETRLHDIKLLNGVIHLLMQPKNFQWRNAASNGKGKVFKDKEVAGIRLSSNTHVFIPPKW